MKKHTNFEEEIETYPSTPNWPVIITVGIVLGIIIARIVTIL